MTADNRRGDEVLALRGEFDLAGATEARKRLLVLEPALGGRLVLDLSELTFLDSSGIRLILQARERALRHGADFVLVPGPEQVMRVLELVGLHGQLETSRRQRERPLDAPEHTPR
jgi:anti-anti-sigma factor